MKSWLNSEYIFFYRDKQAQNITPPPTTHNTHTYINQWEEKPVSIIFLLLLSCSSICVAGSTMSPSAW